VITIRGVRRQNEWDGLRCFSSGGCGSWLLMLSGLLLVVQAAFSDGQLFDFFLLSMML